MAANSSKQNVCCVVSSFVFILCEIFQCQNRHLFSFCSSPLETVFLMRVDKLFASVSESFSTKICLMRTKLSYLAIPDTAKHAQLCLCSTMKKNKSRNLRKYKKYNTVFHIHSPRNLQIEFERIKFHVLLIYVFSAIS